jgi:hypothetical protein
MRPLRGLRIPAKPFRRLVDHDPPSDGAFEGLRASCRFPDEIGREGGHDGRSSGGERPWSSRHSSGLIVLTPRSTAS